MILSNFSETDAATVRLFAPISIHAVPITASFPLKLALPVPDLVVFLDMDPAVSDRLIAARARENKQAEDIHERDKSYLHRCHAAYVELAAKYGWQRVACSSCGQPRSIEDIHADVYTAVQKILG